MLLVLLVVDPVVLVVLVVLAVLVASAARVALGRLVLLTLRSSTTSTATSTGSTVLVPVLVLVLAPTPLPVLELALARVLALVGGPAAVPGEHDAAGSSGPEAELEESYSDQFLPTVNSHQCSSRRRMLTEVPNINILEPSRDLLEPSEAP